MDLVNSTWHHNFMAGCRSLLLANTCSLWSGIKSWPGAGCLQRPVRRRWQSPTTSLLYVHYRCHEYNAGFKERVLLFKNNIENFTKNCLLNCQLTYCFQFYYQPAHLSASEIHMPHLDIAKRMTDQIWNVYKSVKRQHWTVSQQISVGYT